MCARRESPCIFHYTDILPSHGGLETQLTRLCQVLVQEGWRVWVFLRRAPEGDLANPYARMMQASGVRLIAPSSRLDSCLWWMDIRNTIIAALAPLILPVVLLDARLRRRSVRRSWIGACGVIGGLVPDFGLLDVILLLHMAFHSIMERPIALHVHGWPRGIRYGVWLRLPVIFTAHAIFTDPRWRHGIPELKRLANHISLSLDVSEASRQALESTGFRGQSLVLPNMAPMPSQPPAGRPANLTDTLVIGCVGRLSREKGHEYLVRAAALALATCPELRFEIVGDGLCRQDLIRLAHKLNVADRVHFLGHYELGEVDRFLDRIDVFALPSLTEASPVVLIEAMSHGLPIVASQVGGVPEMIKDGISGLLVPPKDPQALAATIVRLAQNPDERHHLGQGAWRRFCTTYTPEVLVRQAIAAYERVSTHAVSPSPEQA